MPERSPLDHLIAGAEAGAWDPAHDIEWLGGPVRPLLIPMPLYRALVSHLHHGERATVSMCERLGREISDPPARRCIAARLRGGARVGGSVAGTGGS